jgi:hypothetical protein
MKQQVIEAFETEFGFIKEKFEIMDILGNNSPMDYETIEYMKLPNEEYNIIWHPGVYVFIGNNLVYRVGRSMGNSRARVMEHLLAGTRNDKHEIWDIDKYPDKSILLINVKDRADKHWLLALEIFLETKFNPLIKAKRNG